MPIELQLRCSELTTAGDQRVGIGRIYNLRVYCLARSVRGLQRVHGLVGSTLGARSTSLCDGLRYYYRFAGIHYPQVGIVSSRLFGYYFLRMGLRSVRLARNVKC